MGGVDPWFDQLYRENSKRLFQMAKQSLGSSLVAEELVQDTFVVLLIKREEVENHENPKGFLREVMWNQIGNQLQKVARMREVPLQEWHENIAAREDSRESLEDILPDWLTEQEKQFLIWKIEDGLSYEEIAHRLGCTVRACHGKMYRLREKFQKKYKKVF